MLDYLRLSPMIGGGSLSLKANERTTTREREGIMERKNGKAWKKKPKVQKKTGRTIGGYSLSKLALRTQKRKGERV